MKCDDDTFVNVPNVIHVLLGGTIPVLNATIKEFDEFTVMVKNPVNRLMITNNLLIGSKYCRPRPVRYRKSKW